MGSIPAALAKVDPGLLEDLSRRAFTDIAFLMPSEQLEGLASILTDPGASAPDRFVAGELLRNAAIAADRIFPLCQDTGTALVYGWRGTELRGEGDEEAAIAAGAAAAYALSRLRNSQIGPRSFLAEANTGDNLPASIDIRSCPGGEYRLVFAIKGGGSANQSSLSMESPALLEPLALENRIAERVRALGASACPPYRISLVLGGSSPEQALYALALASLGLLDALPAAGSGGGSWLRDRDWEALVMGKAAATGIGAQFGGSALALDARAIRLPRHAASLPLAVGAACVAHRRAKAIIRGDGVWLERLEADPSRFLPPELPLLPGAHSIDLDRPMAELAAELASLPAGSFLSLSGTVITARDAAHARFRALLASGGELPDYLLRHPVFYSGPTEAAPGQVMGSFGPTTASRMDAYLGPLLARGASLVSIAKGGRSGEAARALAAAGGSYIACIGGAAALAAREHVLSSEVIDHADLGMEAVRRVVLSGLPAILAIDAKGRDFYAKA